MQGEAMATEQRADGEQPSDRGSPSSYMFELWLDAQEAERRAIIMRLRQIDRILVECGRLSEETLPRRER